MPALVRSKMMSFLDVNEVIATYQHSFFKEKSCFTNLLMTREDWTSAVDQGHGIDIAYLNLSKVFNSVPHQRVLQKLTGYGFSGRMFCRLKGFLSDKCQRVMVPL